MASQVHKDIFEISISQATLKEEDATVYLSQLEAGYEDFVHYDEQNCPAIKELSDAFINNHSMIDFGVVPYYTEIPIHVFRIQNYGHFMAEGLIYSNGIVALYHTNSKVHIHLWVREKTIRNFNYPRPLDVKSTSKEQ